MPGEEDVEIQSCDFFDGLGRLIHLWCEPGWWPLKFSMVKSQCVTDKQQLEFRIIEADAAGRVPGRVNADHAGNLILVMQKDVRLDGFEFEKKPKHPEE